MMKMLIIEDDEKKLKNLKSYIGDNYEGLEVDVAMSYRTGLKKLNTNSYDLVLLDMSMPTYDKCLNEQGGIWEKFGGKKILSEIKRKRIESKVIVVSMYDKFGEGKNADTLDEINVELSNNFPQIYLGKVFYSAKILSWKDNLKKFIDKFTADFND